MFSVRASTLALLALSGPRLLAQTVDDAVMMGKRQLCTGFVYQDDRWDQYWEGTLKRDNLNIGSLTTESVTWVGNYGITNRINVIAMLP